MAKPKKVSESAPRSRLDKIKDKLIKLGLRSDMDLVLHLPLRYEDETQVFPIHQATLMSGSTQVEGIVSACEVQFRPRRQLVVTIADESGQLMMRFLNFYGSQTKQLAEGTRVRARGEIRQGFFGAEMVHPIYKVILRRRAAADRVDAGLSSRRGLAASGAAQIDP